MSIQDWGAIGEILGAVAVFATLVYISVQIRQNTLAMRAETFRSATESSTEFTQLLLNDHDLALIWRKGLQAPDELDDDELYRFTLLVRLQLRRYESVYMQVEQGLLSRDLLIGLENTFRGVYSNDHFREYWRAERHSFLPAYAAVVDELVELKGQI